MMMNRCRIVLCHICLSPKGKGQHVVVVVVCDMRLLLLQAVGLLELSECKYAN